MTLDGKDISDWQRGMNAAVMAGDFTIVKATESAGDVHGYVNPSCDRHYHEAKGDGQLLGVYHFARPSYGNTARAEAEFFMRHTEGYQGDAIFFLDWEDGPALGNVGWAHEFVTHVNNVAGVKPALYMSESVVNSYDWSRVANDDFGLWVAKYRDMIADWNYDMSTAGNAPAVKWWPFYMMWQWTSSGRLPGYDGPIDFNRFYGDADAWRAYARDSIILPGDTPTQPPAPSPDVAIDTYVVQAGDSLWSIAQMFGTTWEHLQAINGIQNPHMILVGQRIRVRGEARTRTYVVGRGDSLSNIAARFNVTWQEIHRANAWIVDPDVIQLGWMLRIP